MFSSVDSVDLNFWQSSFRKSGWFSSPGFKTWKLRWFCLINTSYLFWKIRWMNSENEWNLIRDVERIHIFVCWLTFKRTKISFFQLLPDLSVENAGGFFISEHTLIFTCFRGFERKLIFWNMKEIKFRQDKENWRTYYTILHSSDPWHRFENNMKNANEMKNFIFFNR